MEEFGDTTTTTTTDGALFDASRYAFFGNDIGGEVELGGLEDHEDNLRIVGFHDEEEYLFEKEEDEVLRSLSDIDDLATTFAKLNRVVAGPKSAGAGVIGDRRSRESSTASEWTQTEDFPNWSDYQVLDSDNIAEGKRCSSLPFSPANFMESGPLHRTSSYPEKQQQQQQQPHQQQQPPSQHRLQHYASEPIIAPNSIYSSFPSPVGRSLQASPQNHYLNVPHAQMGLSSHSLSPLSNSSSQFAPGLPNRPPNQWVNQTRLYPGDHSTLINNMLQRHLSHPNGSMHIPHNLVQPPYASRLSGMHSHPYNPHFPPSRLLMSNGEAKTGPRSRQNSRDKSGHHSEIRLPQFRSKYMTADEIESILKLQHTSSHSNDPYIDDYYHQARLAKKSTGAKKQQFCPANLKDLSSRGRGSVDSNNNSLQIDGLGRVPFCLIRRPRPLLEVDSPNSSGEQKVFEKPLEQEIMVAARITIEDCFCVLFDVDDIDRFLECNQLQDGGSQLRRKRLALLQGLATSLQIVDPFDKTGHPTGLTPKDDILFLRIVRLPKGRKLLTRYLQLLFPYGELMRIVCMTIFRHLRYLFGRNLPDVPTDNLARVVSLCVRGMDLGSLSRCLVAVVCSHEQPPLRPIGSPAGDGASVILKSILDRARELLTDSHTVYNYNMTNQLWRASFDEFFDLLTKYCLNKYDSITKTMLMQSPPNMDLDGAEMLEAIGREMPVELLHSSLPHTNEQQRKLLQDFVSRSMNVAGYISQDGHNGGQLNSESVPI
ncbi:hypothetical protein ACFE04_023550 [Oxalis oulophora]